MTYKKTIFLCVAVLGLCLLFTGCMSPSYEVINEIEAESGDGVYLNYMMMESLNDLMEVELPDLSRLVWMLGTFVILLFPVLYLVLKATDRREWFWVAVPILSVLFTAVILLGNRGLRIRKPYSASVTIMEYENDTCRQETILSVLAPHAGSYELRFEAQDADLYFFPSSLNRLGGDEVQNRGEACASHTITVEEQRAFSKERFALVRENVAQTCGLKLDLTRSVDGLSGSIQNDTGRDLEMVSIYLQDQYVMIGAMQAGEVIRFDRAEGRSLLYFSIYEAHIPGIEPNSPKMYQEANLWEAIMYDRIAAMGAEDVYVFAVDKEAPVRYFAEDTVTERNVAALVSHSTCPIQEAPDAAFIILEDYTLGTSSASEEEYLQEYTQEYRIPYTQVYALRCFDPYEATAHMRVFAFNFETEAYDEWFVDGTTETELDKYILEDGTMRVKYVTDTPDELDMIPELGALVNSSSVTGGSAYAED